MTRYVIFLSIIFFSLKSIAQEQECFKKCSHAHLTSKIRQADYYQYASMDKYDVKYLKLNLAVEAGSTFISGTALTVAKLLQPLDSFNIELNANMIVDSVFVNGIRRNFQQGADHVFIPLSPILATGMEIRVLYYYKGTAGYGVYAGTTSTSGLTYTATVSESYEARAWFPVKQILKDKIDSTDIWITTSAINKVGSNGKLVAVVDSPGNKKQYQWKSRHPMNYYMPSFAVGNYREYINYARPIAIAPDSIMVLNYIADNESYFQSVKSNLDKTPAFIEKFSDLFTLYPFSDEKYGHAQANIGGGMEHQTMTTASSFGSTLIAHELTHQWWGDNVTCARWNDIWLNEGFATYGEYLAVENLPGLFPTTTPSAYMQNIHDYVLSQPGGSVYIPDAFVYDENRIFSGRLSYNKGAAIIHNLRFEMQDDTVFFNTLKNYQVQFGDSVATGEDFKHVAEVTSGKNFSDFFNQWYYGEGYPTFNVTYIKQGTDSIILIVNQMTSMPFITTFFKGLYEFKITSSQGDTTVKAYMNVNNQAFKFKYNKTPNGIVVDPNNWVLNTTGTITNGGVVPVKLISFSGNVNNNCVAGLKWTAENEQDNKQYTIELSANGIDFSTIGTVKSHNSIASSNYEFGYNLDGKNVIYFRLKMVDVDGGFSYSQVLPLFSACRGLFSVGINPNPVREKMTMKVNLPTAGPVLVSIFTSTGGLVYKKEMQLRQGSNVMLIDDTRSFLPGSYFVRLQNSNEVLNQKFIKW